MSGVVPPIHLYDFMAWARTNLTSNSPYRVSYRVVRHRQDVMIIPGYTASHTTKPTSNNNKS